MFNFTAYFFKTQQDVHMENNKQFLPIGIILLLFLFNACKKGDNCALTCENNGILTIDCTCACPSGFEGPQCETASCTLDCINGGQVTTQCTCDCPEGFTGQTCDVCLPKVGFFDRTTLWSPSNMTNYVDNVEATLPANYILTGLGFSTSSTIMLAGREVNQDGTLGDELQFRDGNNPNGSLDVSYIVPANHVITGIGYGLDGLSNVTRLVVNYSEITFDADCDLELGPPQLYDNGASDSVDVWMKISDTNLDTRYHGFRSVGIKYVSPRQIDGLVGELFNQF